MESWQKRLKEKKDEFTKLEARAEEKVSSLISGLHEKKLRCASHTGKKCIVDSVPRQEREGRGEKFF